VPDTPEHVIEIPESLGRDVDRFREGKGPAPPAEAFLSDASLAQIEARTTPAAAAPPVPAEALVPISKAEAARRTMFDGQTLPSMPVTRRVKPAPFRRDRIEVSRHGRTWQYVAAEKVQAGDTVPGVGEVEHRQIVRRHETVAGRSDVAVGMKVILTGKGGNVLAFDLQEKVHAHRLAE